MTTALRTSRLLLAALGLVSMASVSSAQDAEPVAESAPQGSRVGVWVPTDSGAREANLLVDGDRVRAQLGDEVPTWRVVLLFDRLLSQPLTFRNGAVRLAEQAELLTSLGPVEVAVLDGEVRPSLPPTRDAALLGETLAWMRLREIVEGSQLVLRRELTTELANEAALPEAGAALAAQALTLERELVRQQLDALLLWASEQTGPEPKLLVLVSSGFDGPAPFYDDLVPEEPVPATRGPSIDAVAGALAGDGWTVLPLSPAAATDALLDGDSDASAAEQARARLDEEVEASVLGPDADGGGALTFDLLRRREGGEEEAAQEPVLLVDPSLPLRTLAAASGGEVLTQAVDLPRAVAGLKARRRAELPLDGAPGVIETEDGTVVWRGSSGGEALAAARARRVLEAGDLEAPLELAALVDHRGGEPTLVVEPVSDDWIVSGPGVVRLTIAVEGAEGEMEIVRREDVVGDGDTWGGWSVPLPLEPGADPAVAVVAEADGVIGWGAASAGHVGLDAAGDFADVDGLLLPAPRTIHLLAPAEGLLLGPTRFRTVISDPAVRRVDFYVDDEREAVRRTAPFEADLDLGSLPRLRRIEAVALDSSGAVLGRDSLIVNGGSAAFQIALSAPGREARGGNVTADGSLTVEAEVQVPRSRSVLRVEFYWRDRLVGVESSPPYRHTVAVPAERPQGFVRAVAHLLDGASAEDVLFVNSPGSTAALDVTLVQLYVVVTDREGEPVRGLTEDSFRLREEGDQQPIASFSDASDLPLTLGLAIDSSASMFIKLPDVQVAATEFLRDLMEPLDRAFVVGFGGEPRLFRSTTSDLPALADGITEMTPDGRTAIWKSIVYSLVQLQGVPGKKALVVYSDGADEDPDFAYRTARRFARLVGVPIYVILSNNEIVRTQGEGLNVRGFLNRLEELVDEVGGRVFLTRVGDDLDDVYTQIADELRSQYVLGYYAETRDLGEWREIDVDVTEPGLTARSAAGYYQ